MLEEKKSLSIPLETIPRVTIRWRSLDHSIFLSTLRHYWKPKIAQTYMEKKEDGSYDMEKGLNIDYYFRAHYNHLFGRMERNKDKYKIDDNFMKLMKSMENENNKRDEDETYCSTHVEEIIRQYKTIFQTNITKNAIPRTRRYLRSRRTSTMSINHLKKK